MALDLFRYTSGIDSLDVESIPWMLFLIVAGVGVVVGITRRQKHGKDPVEKFKNAVTSAWEEYKKAADREVWAAEQHFEKESGHTLKAVGKRKRLARELELNKKIAAIYSEAKHYPAWSRRDDWEKWKLCEFDDITGECEGNVTTMSFLLNRNRYRFVYEDG